MALNAPRTIPYDFKVFEMDGVVYLYDDSTRTYVCSSQPMIWAEPIYFVDVEIDADYPDCQYIEPEFVAKLPQGKPAGDFPADLDEKEAWSDARESAHANHVL